MKRVSVNTFLLVLLLVLAVLLTALPDAVAYKRYFGNGYVYAYCYGFDRSLIGYGHPMPVFAGICSCVCVLFGIRYGWTGKDLERLENFACIGAACWCLSGLNGTLTWVCIAAFILLAATAWVARYQKKRGEV